MNQKCNSCHQREGTRANIINLLCEYVKSGNQYYLQQTNCEDERKYNYIIGKFEELKQNKKNQNNQACLIQKFQKLLATPKRTEQYEAEISIFYNKKQANVICERLRIIHERDQILEDVIISLKKYNEKTKLFRFTSAHSVKEQVDSLINKIYFYQEAIKIISEYPTNVNMEIFKEFNSHKAASLDQIQKSNLEKIYCIKETIRTIERILQPFRTSMNKHGFIDEQLTDKILVPCQNLIQIRKQAQKSLSQLCNSNTYTKFQSKSNSIIPLNKIIEVISKQQMKMKEAIAIMNQKIQLTLHRCKFPFVQSQPSILITRSIDNMISKIDSIYEIVNYYSIFGDRIQDLKVKSDKDHNYISSLKQQLGRPSMASKKEIWRKKLSNNLRFLKDQLKIDIQVQIKQFKHQSPKQIILEGQIETETSINKLSQEQQQTKKTLAQLCDQNRVFIKRWQTIWIRLELEKKHNNYIDPLKIPLKGENDEQLKALCEEIQNLSECKQILTKITGKDVYLSNQRLTMIKKNFLFLSANLDISQQIYKDKQIINKFIQIQNKLKIQISQINEAYKDLYSQYQVVREILDKIFEKMQLIKNQLNLTVLRQQNSSKYQQISIIVNALTSKNTYTYQRCTILQQQKQCLKEGQNFLKIQLEEVKRSKKVLEIEKEQIIKSLQRSQSKLKQQLKIKDIQISQLVEMQETLDQRYKKTLSQHNNTINQLNAQKLLRQSNKKQITQLSHQLQAKNQVLLQLQLLNKTNNRKLELNQTDLSRANNQNLKLKETLETIKFQSFFNIKGQIYNNIHVVNVITKQIKAYFNRNITSATNLLFLDKRMIQIKSKIDVTSLCNHQYNFIVLKTTNKTIACFLSTPLSLITQKIIHKPVEKSFLLVGNEANCQIYYPKESNKLNFEINSVHSYIIIGKSDLRIDLIQGKITSNMGQNEAQFDSKGKKGKEIFGGDNIPFESLEIYKVQFQEKKNQQYSVKCKTYSQIGEKKITYSTLQIKNQVEQYKNQVEADYTRQVQPQFEQNNQDFFKSAYQEVKQNYQRIAKSFQSKIYSHIARYLQPKINLQAIEKRVADFKDRKKEGEQHIKLLSESLDQYKQRCFNLQKNIDQLKISNQRYRQNQQSSQNIIQSNKKQILNLNTLVKKQKLQISNLSLQLQTTKNDLNNQQLQLENIKLEKQMMQQEKHQSNQSDQTQLQNQKRKVQEQKRKYKDLQANKQRQINWLQEQLRQLRDKVDRLQNDYTNATKQIKQKNLIILESKKQIENINKTMKNNEYKKAPETSLRQKLQKQISSKQLSQFEAHKKKLIKLYTQRCSNYPPEIKEANLNQIFLTFIERFFQGDLLQDQIILKYHLMSHIQKLTGTQIIRTKLIYNFDLRNKANFHVYIDKVQSLLCIIKLKSGVFLAGYYTGEYLQGPMTQPGLLINLTKNESYYLNVAQNSSKSSYRAMVYDSYFIIFGNAQIRIKTGQNILFSNFGIANSYFNANNKKLVDFIGENKREVQLESYEIYQVLFNNTFDRNE